MPLSVDARECPGCQVPLETTHETATIEDTPIVPPRVIKRFKVEIGRCPLCGRTVRGHHPDLSPNQTGATAHQVGPHVKENKNHWKKDAQRGDDTPRTKSPQVARALTMLKGGLLAMINEPMPVLFKKCAKLPSLAFSIIKSPLKPLN